MKKNIIFTFFFAISAWTSGLSSGSDIDSMYQRNITGDYICVNCGYTNKYKQNMQKHVETHIDVPRAICKFCYRTFKTTNSLQSHISTKHREKTTLSMSLSQYSYLIPELVTGFFRMGRLTKNHTWMLIFYHFSTSVDY